MKLSILALAANAGIGAQATTSTAEQGQMTENIGADRASAIGKQRDDSNNGNARLDAAAAYCPQLTCPDGDCCSYNYPICCPTVCCPRGYPYCGTDGRCYDR